jgi:L-Ala-D/L-Glu epimerase / N-acetyl-D-glutamate racemase
MIEDVELRRLEVPLKRPYKLAFGPVHHFDTILVRVIADGRAGYGEATILTGYTDEEIGESWRLANVLAERLRGLGIAAAKTEIAQVFVKAPFTATALTTAMEMCEGCPFLDISEPEQVLLLGAIESTEMTEIESEVDGLVAAGYRTLKVKVGFDPEKDAARVGGIQRIVRGRAQLRIDANQGYTPDQARRFASKTDPAGIQLFEQPCPAEDWEGAAFVAKDSPLPIMLDESIYGEADIERAAALKSIAFVKLKLMKLGSLKALAHGLERIRELGMEPVLGNGVATEIGCWMESCVARSHIGNAGEMNGFLRQRIRLAPNSMPVRNGHVVLDGPPVLDTSSIESVTVQRAQFTRQLVRAGG